MHIRFYVSFKCPICSSVTDLGQLSLLVFIPPLLLQPSADVSPRSSVHLCQGRPRVLTWVDQYEAEMNDMGYKLSNFVCSYAPGFRFTVLLVALK